MMIQNKLIDSTNAPRNFHDRLIRTLHIDVRSEDLFYMRNEMSLEVLRAVTSTADPLHDGNNMVYVRKCNILVLMVGERVRGVVISDSVCAYVMI